jgi:2,3-bisphosphoglycerate-independent phosphoglycerate mutase
MKYVVVLGDGMADYPVAELGGKTPLQAADKPNIDALASKGTLGLVKTVPEGMAPGSDTANLAVMGYDPRVYYSGRSPFEAASMGIPLHDSDITFRCNLVTLSENEDYAERVMLDHSADEISSDEARKIMEEISQRFASRDIAFYPGVSYRHLMVWHNGPSEWQLTPPHDILGSAVKEYLPAGPDAPLITAMMKESASFLVNHPVNRARVSRGLRPANSIWIWGEGRKPQIPPFSEKFGLTGAVISAVDLIKGLGICAGLKSIDVEGATGTLQTNFLGKANAAVDALKGGLDFVYIHIEAPDECGHRQETDNKVKAIELIDRLVVKTLKEKLDSLKEPYKILFLPDHATPLSLRTHTADPVPFLIYDSMDIKEGAIRVYDETSAADAGFFLGEGYKLMDLFLGRKEEQA